MKIPSFACRLVAVMLTEVAEDETVAIESIIIAVIKISILMNCGRLRLEIKNGSRATFL